MSKEKGKEYLSMFLTWVESMDDNSFKQIVYAGQLNRQQIKKLSGISDQAIKKNAKVKNALASLEDDLRLRGVLPPLTEKGQKQRVEPSVYKSDSQQLFDKKRLAALETENQELKAHVKLLQEKLEKHADTVDAIDELGVYKLV